jgi:hypothetical protein
VQPERPLRRGDAPGLLGDPGGLDPPMTQRPGRT